MAVVTRCGWYALLGLALAAIAPLAAAQGTPAPQPARGTAATATTPQPAGAAAPGSATNAQGGATPDATGQAGTAATAPRNLAGTVNLVDGDVKVVGPDKVGRTVKVGDQIYEGDAIVTGDNAELHIDMADGGFIAVRPNTQLRVFKYQANGDDQDHSVLGLIKGSLRSITGWIGKNYPKSYSVVTPSATIGVRGTDHEPAYLPEGSTDGDAGTYDQVHEGATTIGNAHGQIEVTPGKAGFVDHRGLSKPRVLASVPKFFQVPRRHDNVFVGKHAEVLAHLEQKRQARIQQHAQELHRPTSMGARAEEKAARAGEVNRPGAASQGLARPTLAQRLGNLMHPGAAAKANANANAAPAAATPAARAAEAAANQRKIAEENAARRGQAAEKEAPKKRKPDN